MHEARGDPGGAEQRNTLRRGATWASSWAERPSRSSLRTAKTKLCSKAGELLDESEHMPAS
eukprot:3844270-Rhodomonas_salina.1